jgi:Fe(3+) dicitrate transport protein
MDFSNQVVPSSIAGGAGAALTNAGATRHAGLEFAVNVNVSQMAGTRTPIETGASYTYLAVARYHGPRFVFVGTTPGDGIGRVFVGQNAATTRDRIQVTGNRLPYAPTHLASVWGSVEPRRGTRVRGDVIVTSAMFADPLNTAVLSPDGQQGPIPRSAIWNLGLWQEIPALGVELSLGIKNLFDRLYVVDRSRGLLPGPARTVSLGATRAF